MWKFLHLYGTLFLYFTLAAVIVVPVLVALWRRDVEYGRGMIATQFGAGLVIFLSFVSNDLIVGNIVRASRYAFIFAAVIVAFGLLRALDRGNTVKAAVVVTVILATAVIGVGGVYEPNRHLTYSEYDGTEFLLTHNQGEDIYSADTSHKMEEYVLGTTYPDLWPGYLSDNRVPARLGYEREGVTATDTFDGGMLVTKAHDRERHTAPYYTDDQQEYLFLYGARAMERLHQDRTANKVYTNGQFEGWDTIDSG